MIVGVAKRRKEEKRRCVFRENRSSCSKQCDTHRGRRAQIVAVNTTQLETNKALSDRTDTVDTPFRALLWHFRHFCFANVLVLLLPFVGTGVHTAEGGASKLAISVSSLPSSLSSSSSSSSSSVSLSLRSGSSSSTISSSFRLREFGMVDRLVD